MDETTPTDSASAPQPRRYRWVWRVCWVLLAVMFVAVLYLVMTMEPALYSPAAAVRTNDEYKERMNPPRLSDIGTKAPDAVMPQVTVTTNQQGRVRIEYPIASDKRVEVVGFTVHRIEAGETVQLGAVSASLKRIGHVWVPPGTNTQYNLPAQFYGPDFQPLSDAELIAEMPNKWDRTMNCRTVQPAYRFDLELKGGAWKFVGANLYDARTHTGLTFGWSGQKMGDTIYKIGLDPFIWHAAPVELVVDVVVGPVEVEEIRPLAGESFTVGASRYQLVYAGDDPSGGLYSHGNDSKTGYVELGPPSTTNSAKKPTCVLIFHATPPAAQSVFHIDYLDAEGKEIDSAGTSWSGAQIIQGKKGTVADIKTIRVHKYGRGHRLVFRLPYLPGLPPENQHVDNLFEVRVPVLRFDRDYQQAEYIRRMTQMSLPYISRQNLPPGTYPRLLTHATVAEVLEDYRQAMGVTNYFYVDQEKLTIEKGDRDWLQQVQEKVMKTWKKLTGP